MWAPPELVSANEAEAECDVPCEALSEKEREAERKELTKNREAECEALRKAFCLWEASGAPPAWRDKKAGPPKPDWKWLDTSGIRLTVEAWVPPNLLGTNEPDAEMPVPLPLPHVDDVVIDVDEGHRDLCLTEKYAVLVSIHDTFGQSMEPIVPEDAHVVALYTAKGNVPDKDRETLHRFLKEVKRDLAGTLPDDAAAYSRKHYSPAELRKLFDVSQGKLKAMLNSQTIRNVKHSTKDYQIHVDDLPSD